MLMTHKRARQQSNRGRLRQLSSATALFSGTRNPLSLTTSDLPVGSDLRRVKTTVEWGDSYDQLMDVYTKIVTKYCPQALGKTTTIAGRSSPGAKLREYRRVVAGVILKRGETGRSTSVEAFIEWIRTLVGGLTGTEHAQMLLLLANRLDELVFTSHLTMPSDKGHLKLKWPMARATKAFLTLSPHNEGSRKRKTKVLGRFVRVPVETVTAASHHARLLRSGRGISHRTLGSLCAYMDTKPRHRFITRVVLPCRRCLQQPCYDSCCERLWYPPKYADFVAQSVRGQPKPPGFEHDPTVTARAAVKPAPSATDFPVSDSSDSDEPDIASPHRGVQYLTPLKCRYSLACIDRVIRMRAAWTPNIRHSIRDKAQACTL